MEKKIRCKKCGDVIESQSRHDLVFCSCGAVYIDGGNDYLRFGGNKEDIQIIQKQLERNDKNA